MARPRHGDRHWVCPAEPPAAPHMQSGLRVERQHVRGGGADGADADRADGADGAYRHACRKGPFARRSAARDNTHTSSYGDDSPSVSYLKRSHTPDRH